MKSKPHEEPAQPDNEPLLTVNQVAGMLHVSRSHLYYLIDSGQLPAVRLGKRMLRFRPRDVRSYITEKVPEGG